MHDLVSQEAAANDANYEVRPLQEIRDNMTREPTRYKIERKDHVRMVSGREARHPSYSAGQKKKLAARAANVSARQAARGCRALFERQTDLRSLSLELWC